MSTFLEPAREISIVEETDVIIAGAGPAGVMAAIAAARSGVRVRLIEAHGALGGIWTVGALPHIIEFDKGGLVRELLHRLEERGAGSAPDFDVEMLKVELEAMASEAGVDVRLYTRVSAAYRDDSGAISTIVTDSKSGREAWRARVYVDCTGDGDLAAQAGCGFEIGHPESGKCQPMSVMAILSGAGRSDEPPFSIREWNANKTWILEEIRRGGHDPSYSKPTLFLVRPGHMTMMANHEYGYRHPDAQLLTDATIHGRAENLAIVEALRRSSPRWNDLRVFAQSSQIGVRESRRIDGLYRVTLDDVSTGARFPDAVCRVGFSVDIHSLDPGNHRGIEEAPVRTVPYDIPLRALISRDAPNLMMAGRCISGDFYAHASYRVSGDAAALGEAAGITAAIAAASHRSPRDVEFPEVAVHLPAAVANAG